MWRQPALHSVIYEPVLAPATWRFGGLSPVTAAVREPAGNPEGHSMSKPAVPLSGLDLSPVPAGSTVAEALRNSVELAVTPESWGT